MAINRNHIVTGQSLELFDKVFDDADRNFWMNAQEAREYGMVDDILVRKD